jgi:hypothetical protein
MSAPDQRQSAPGDGEATGSDPPEELTMDGAVPSGNGRADGAGGGPQSSAQRQTEGRKGWAEAEEETCFLPRF